MWLKQQEYILSIIRDTASQDDNFENINVKLNGNLTTIKLIQLFAKISKHEFSDDGKKLRIIGWSILQSVKDDKLKIGENEIDISFEAEELGLLSITKIENPWFMLNDLKLSNEEVESINSKLLELSGSQIGDNDTGEEGLPQTSPPAIINSIYDKGRESFIKRGFKEYSKDNFRFLILKTEDSLKANLIELINEDKLVQLQDPKIVIEGFYKFNDEANNRVINVKIIDESLEISFSDVEIEEEEPEL